MGMLRLVLAIAVVISHSGCLFGYCSIGRVAAVQSFFLISGFLMALILNEKYGPSRNWLFYSNRALRIYVPYFVVWTVTLLLGVGLAVVGRVWLPTLQTLYSTAPSFDPVTWAYVVITNIVIIGQDLAYWLGYNDGGLYFTQHFSDSTIQVWLFELLPQAWTVSLELTFYALAPFLVRRNIVVLLLVFAASFEAREFGMQYGLSYDPWFVRFFPFELYLFVAGAIAYGVYTFVRPLIEQRFVFSAAVALVAVGSTFIYSFPAVNQRFYLGMFLALPFLFTFNKESKIDRSLGDLSYPIYLIHWPVQGLLYMLGLTGLTWRGPSCVIVSVALSYLFLRVVERPLDAARQRRLSAKKPIIGHDTRDPSVGPLEVSILKILKPLYNCLAPYRARINVTACIFTVVLLATFILQYVEPTITQGFQGPFERNSSSVARYVVPIGTNIPFLSIDSPTPSSEHAQGDVSPLRMWINGKIWNAPDTPDPSIVQGKILGIRGLYRTLLFTLPDAIANNSSTTLRIEYRVRLHGTMFQCIVNVTVALLLCALIFPCFEARGLLDSGADIKTGGLGGKNWGGAERRVLPSPQAAAMDSL